MSFKSFWLKAADLLFDSEWFVHYTMWAVRRGDRRTETYKVVGRNTVKRKARELLDTGKYLYVAWSDEGTLIQGLPEEV
jgi:hypothetical protein